MISVKPRWGGLLVGLVACAGVARGEGRGVDSQMFRPTIDSFGIFSVDSAQTGQRWDFGFKFFGNYAQAPLTGDMPGVKGTEDKLLDFDATMNLGFHLAPLRMLEVGIDVPITVVNVGEGYGQNERVRKSGFFLTDARTNMQPGEGGPGDVRIGAKARLMDVGSIRIGAAAIVSVPFGDERIFTGDEDFSYEPKLILDYNSGPMLVAFNVGARIRKRTTVLVPQSSTDLAAADNCEQQGGTTQCTVLDVGSEGAFGAGFRYGFTPTLAVAAESFGTFPIAGNDATLEALGGVILALRGKGDLLASIGGGRSILNADRSNDFRVFAGLSWTPTSDAVAVGQIGTRADKDGDGVPDDIDGCPEAPEDKDSYEDNDGCPDPDNDGDGVADADDKCKNETEDKDGFDDDDGCPDFDNDNDGVKDVADTCIMEPEDKDGYQDDDGCPDLDNDGDGIADRVDQCPNEAETPNGIDDTDGCPDTGTQTGPQVAGGIIDLRGDKVDFTGKTSNLDATSKALLDQVADLLKQTPRVRIRVEAHTEAGKGREVGQLQTLSEQRANAVRAYLVSKGVDGDRIGTAGYGGSRPIGPNDTAANKAKNRRVELIVLEQ